jgi:hypothetical protein
VQASRVNEHLPGGLSGQGQPGPFLLGAADLAATRFSGRLAPRHPGGVPNCADWVQQLAYSHEVSSCGFWPGGSEEGSFYAYAYPAPDGFPQWPVQPSAARFDDQLGELILPYASVRMDVAAAVLLVRHRCGDGRLPVPPQSFLPGVAISMVKHHIAC